MCIKMVPHVKRDWQLSFVTICVEHARSLVDRSDRCAGKLRYRQTTHGRNDASALPSFCLCKHCNASATAKADVVSPDAIEFQTMLLEQARGASDGTGDATAQARSFFKGLRVALDLHTAEVSPPYLTREGDGDPRRHILGTDFRDAPARARFQTVESLGAVSKGRLGCFQELCDHIGENVGSLTLQRRGSVLAVLQEIAEALQSEANICLVRKGFHELEIAAIVAPLARYQPGTLRRRLKEQILTTIRGCFGLPHNRQTGSLRSFPVPLVG
jgi:hypothetical protein